MFDGLHWRPTFLLFLFPFFIYVGAQANDASYPYCPSYNCSNTIIRYPFWMMTGTESATQFCGYQAFGIQCSNNIPIFSLGSGSYYVSRIDYEFKNIVLTYYNVSTAVQFDCPRVPYAIDLETLPFKFIGQNVNLSFHYNCTSIPSFATEINCLRSGTKRSCVNDQKYELQNFSWDELCDAQVVTTVLSLDGSSTPRRVQENETLAALKYGFQLGWERMQDCKKCEESGGLCGRNSEDNKKVMCFCSGGEITKADCRGSSIEWRNKLVFGVGLSLLLLVLLMFAIYGFIKFSPRICVALFKHKTEGDKSVDAFVMQYGNSCTKRYTYVDIKKMTTSFKEKLGDGGFGTVFKGKLLDGRLVAVKILDSSKGSGQDFINEVSSIGRTSHVNIVALLGFCCDYKKRALVYEFMPNGSLEKFIFSHDPLKTSHHIEVNKLYDIVLGIARGLDYLHRGCNTRILHLDIKPANILLDEDFCPKIADFGLAKLYSRKESIVSMLEARGTIGYIAPEVFNRNFGGVSHKSDVYSYGMLMLEMVGGRKNVDVGVGVGSGHTSEIYFPNWIYNRLKKEELILDGITTAEQNDYARKMTIVGLWCIQTNPKQRPSINEVIEMLEGSMEALEIPPKPFFFSPPRSTPTTNNTWQEAGTSR